MLGKYVDFGVRTTRTELDVENLEQARAFCHAHMPTVIFHFAAATDLIATEKDPVGTFRANAVGTYNMGLIAREINAKLVTVSTSAVFDGIKKEPYREEDIPNPKTEYGHAKYMGELVTGALTPNHLIVRTCWMFGGGKEKDHKFVANILRQIDAPSIKVITGKQGSPTYGKDFVEALCALVEKDVRGIVHLGNAGAPTRVDIAREIVRITGSETEIIEVGPEAFEAEYPGVAARGNESIISDRVTLRSWEDALAEYIHTEWPDSIRV
jgi:dTDP-4-dehydrorhamnose reductase